MAFDSIKQFVVDGLERLTLERIEDDPFYALQFWIWRTYKAESSPVVTDGKISPAEVDRLAGELGNFRGVPSRKIRQMAKHLRMNRKLILESINLKLENFQPGSLEFDLREIGFFIADSFAVWLASKAYDSLIPRAFLAAKTVLKERKLPLVQIGEGERATAELRSEEDGEDKLLDSIEFDVAYN